jgi:hypothetical protein
VAEWEAESTGERWMLLWALGVGEIDNARFRELAEELDMDRRGQRAQQRCRHQWSPYQ